MNEYEFVVSLSISHPDFNPEVISKELGMTPFRSQKVGELRRSPKGNELGGVYRQSSWAARLHSSEKLQSSDIALEDFLAECNEKLSDNAGFFGSLVSTGGYIEYFVGWFGLSDIGATFSPTLMIETAKLNIAIGLDVYPA